MVVTTLFAVAAFAQDPAYDAGTVDDCVAWGADKGYPTQTSPEDPGFLKRSATLKKDNYQWHHLATQPDRAYWSLCVVLYPEGKGSAEDLAITRQRAAVIDGIFQSAGAVPGYTRILIDPTPRPAAEATQIHVFIMPREEFDRRQATAGASSPAVVAATPAAPALPALPSDDVLRGPLAQILAAAPTNFESLKGAPQGDKGNVWQSTVALPGAVETTVQASFGYSARANFGTFANEAEAHARFDAVNDALARALGSTWYASGAPPYDERVTKFAVFGEKSADGFSASRIDLMTTHVEAHWDVWASFDSMPPTAFHTVQGTASDTSADFSAALAALDAAHAKGKDGFDALRGARYETQSFLGTQTWWTPTVSLPAYSCALPGPGGMGFDSACHCDRAAASEAEARATWDEADRAIRGALIGFGETWVWTDKDDGARRVYVPVDGYYPLAARSIELKRSGEGARWGVGIAFTDGMFL